MAQVEKEHNVLLDECDRFREDMGEITDNISLATALETIWVSRREESASGTDPASHFAADPALLKRILAE